MLKEVAIINKVAAEKAKTAETQKANHTFKINDRVRLEDGSATGIISKIEKKNVFINYGIFTTKAKISMIELVEKAK